MTRPTHWATDTNYSAGGATWNGTATKKEPSAGKKATGFLPGAKLAAEHLNWILSNFAAAIDSIYDLWISNWAPMSVGTTSGTSPSFQAIVFGDADQTWVAVGGSNTAAIIQSSTDGYAWTARTAAASYAGKFSGAGYAGGNFAIAGDSAEIQTSPDGATWTHRAAAGGYAGTFYALIGSDMPATPVFVAIGGTGEIQTCIASSLASWTHRVAGSSYAGTFRSACFADGLFGGTFWICGDTHELQRCGDTSDVTTWSRVSTGISSGNFKGIAYGNGTLVVGKGTSAIVSTDGAAFTEITNALDAGGFCSFESISFGGGLFVATVTPTSSPGGVIFTSADGIVWTKRIVNNSTYAYFASAFGPSYYEIAGWDFIGGSAKIFASLFKN